MWRLGEMVVEEAFEVVEGSVVVRVVMGGLWTEMKAVRGRRYTPGLQQRR